MPQSSTATYNTSNQMISATQNGGSALVYDAAGNVTNDGLNSYLYDAEGRICAVNTRGNLQSSDKAFLGYIYDAAGIRVARGYMSTFSCNFSTNGFVVTTSWALGQGGEQVGEWKLVGSTWTWQHSNAYADGKLLGTYDQSGLHFYFNDWLGTRRIQTNALGQVELTCTSLPFGNGETCTASALSTAEDPTEHHFTGKERDTESGNDYFGARYYASTMGRFMSPDPLLSSGRPWDPQTWNRYSYALNHPLRFTDPTGLYEWDASLGGTATDKQLKKNAGKDRAAKATAKSIISQRKAIRSELGALANSGVASLTSAASAIGGENQNNGVTISMGSVTPGASAEVSSTLPLTMNANGNPMLNLTTRPGASGAGLFIDLAHEGTHISDAQRVAGNETGPMLHIVSEIHGYSSSIDAARYLGWGSIGPQGGAPFWSSSWSATDQQTRPSGEIFNFLQHSPVYQGSNWHLAFEKP